jgi:hypothetical protein
MEDDILINSGYMPKLTAVWIDLRHPFFTLGIFDLFQIIDV